MALQSAGSGWECDRDDKALWRCQPVKMSAGMRDAPDAAPSSEEDAEAAAAEIARVVAEPQPEPEPQVAEPGPAGLPAFDLEGYVLQVGAYTDGDTARATAAEIDSELVLVVLTRRQQEDWYVLLYGNYPSYEAAQTAGEQFARDYPHASWWVRDTEAIRKVLLPAPVADP